MEIRQIVWTWQSRVAMLKKVLLFTWFVSAFNWKTTFTWPPHPVNRPSIIDWILSQSEDVDFISISYLLSVSICSWFGYAFHIRKALVGRWQCNQKAPSLVILQQPANPWFDSPLNASTDDAIAPPYWWNRLHASSQTSRDVGWPSEV